MRFPIVLAVVAALTSSISARPTDPETDIDGGVGACPIFCVRQSNCKHCPDQNCVSMSSLHPGFNHTTHRRGSSSIYVSSTTVSRVSTFTLCGMVDWYDA